MLALDFPPVSMDFLADFDSPVSVITGPVGTGKTFVLAQKSFIAAQMVRPINGVRKSKFLITRTTAGELDQSILKDLEDKIYPNGILKFRGQYPKEAHCRFKIADGTIVDVTYIAGGSETLDQAKKHYKSVEFTAVIIVEAQTLLNRSVISFLFSRSRVPNDSVEGLGNIFDLTDGAGNVVKSIQFGAQGRMWLDMNFTHNEHWFYQYLVTQNKLGRNGQKARTLHEQPPIFLLQDNPNGEFFYRHRRVDFIPNPEAEPYTLRYCQKDDDGHDIAMSGYEYWRSKLIEYQGDDNQITQDILADWGTKIEGKPVFPKFNNKLHVADSALPVQKGVIYCGVDNGLNNAWIFGQLDFGGRLNILSELSHIHGLY